MGKHSRTPRGPIEIGGLNPASESSETIKDALRRQSEVRVSPAEMARRRTRNKRVAFGCVGVFVLLLVVAVVGALAYKASIDAMLDRNVPKAVKDALKPPATEPPKPPGEPFYMAIIGADHRPDEKVSNSDTLIVAYVDPPHRRINLLSIPRDSRVSIPGHGKNKINAAMLLGGPALTIETVKQLTGLPITHYMQVDFNGFKGVVDAMGGVYLNVPQKIFDPQAANHDFHAEVIEKGYRKLDGAHALTFVRARHQFADGDFQRMKNQQTFLKAMAKQMLTLQNVPKIPTLVNEIFGKGAVTTDMNVDELLGLAQDFKGAGDSGIAAATVPGEPKYINGISYIILDKPGLEEIVQRMEAGESLETTTTSATATPVISAKSVSVAVRNGAGQAGLAKEVSDMLKRSDFRISEVGNTARPVFDHTLIVFKTNDAKAKLVHDSLGFGTVLKSSTLYQFKTDVLVIVGKDWRKQFPKAASN